MGVWRVGAQGLRGVDSYNETHHNDAASDPLRRGFHTMFQICRKAVHAVRWRALMMPLVLTGLTACSVVTPYKPEVVQGNFVSYEQVQALRPGMPRQAVREILGTPLVSSLFHADRWDYAFSIRRQGTQPQQRRFTVFFEGERLARIEGDDLPTEAEFAARLESRQVPTKLPPLKASEEQLARYPARAMPAPEPSAPAATMAYPPLEPMSR